MALLNITAAARAVGVDRSTITRQIKSGKISTIKDHASRTCIDTSELLRVFGQIKTQIQNNATTNAHINMMHTDAYNGVSKHTEELIISLKEQLEEAKQREKDAKEREKKLFIMLEQEQKNRKELEFKILPQAKNGLLKKIFG